MKRMSKRVQGNFEVRHPIALCKWHLAHADVDLHHRDACAHGGLATPSADAVLVRPDLGS